MNNTLLKGLAVLELLSRSDRPLGLTQIATELGMVKSNVHRLMQALSETRYVIRDEANATYGPSIKLWELGSAVLSKLDLRRHAERQMEVLLEKTGESVHLSVLDREEVVYVHKIDSQNPVRAYSQIGGRAPAHCVATGKAQLAYLRDDVLLDMAQRLEAHTRASIVDPRAFMRELRVTRQRGYAVNRGEWREGVWGIGAPIMDARGVVIAALGISGPTDRMRKRKSSEFAMCVTRAATDVSEALGGHPSFGALAPLRRLELNARE